MKANEVEEEPRDGPQQGAEGPAEVLPQEWSHHEDVGPTDEPNKQDPARRAEATTDDDKSPPEEGAGAQGNPQLVGFWDGGKSASTACLYVRYKTGDTNYEARLLASKARVKPSSDKTGKPQV